jgi:hypothetical protein
MCDAFLQVGICVHLARTATATVTKKTLLWELTQDAFRAWSKAVPEFFDAYQRTPTLCRPRPSLCPCPCPCPLICFPPFTHVQMSWMAIPASTSRL